MLSYLVLVSAITPILADLSKINVEYSINGAEYTRLIDVDIKGIGINATEIIVIDCTINVLEPEDFPELPLLETLIFHGVELDGLRSGCLAKLGKLMMFRIRMTDLKSIPRKVFEGSVSLQNIHLNNNEIGEISDEAFSNLPFLVQLDLSCNKLSAVDPAWFSHCDKLFELDLSENELVHIQNGAFVSVPSLKDLKLSYNKIVSVEDDAFKDIDLEVLYLNNNQISVIKDNTFKHFKRLINVKLGFNKLKCLTPSALNSLAKVEYIDMRHNHLDKRCNDILRKFKLKYSVELLYLITDIPHMIWA